MQSYDIDPLKITDKSLYDRTTFVDNALLKKLREERQALLEQKRKRRSIHKKPTRCCPNCGHKW